jgi:hypothetical protein
MSGADSGCVTRPADHGTEHDVDQLQHHPEQHGGEHLAGRCGGRAEPGLHPVVRGPDDLQHALEQDGSDSVNVSLITAGGYSTKRLRTTT